MKNFILFVIIFLSSLTFSQDSKDVNKYVTLLLEQANQSIETNGVKAVSYLEKAFTYEAKVEDSIKFDLYQTAGNIYFSQESYHVALKYYNKQLELEGTNKKTEKLLIYSNIGNVYWRLNNIDKARIYWNKSLEGLKQSKENKRNPESYIVYNNLAVLERTQGNYIKALEMLDEYVEHSICLKDSAGLVKAYQNISINHINLKEYTIAYNYFQKAKKIASEAGLKNDLGNIYYNLGSFYTEISPNRDSAEYYHLKAFELGNQYQFPFVKKISTEALIGLYEREGNYLKANRYLHVAKSLGEEMITDENLKKITQLEQEHKQKMRDKDLLLKQKKKEIIYLISGIVLVSILIIALLVLSLQKNKLKRRTAENHLLASQLEEKNKKLTGNAIQMLQTNEILDTTHRGLTELKNIANVHTKKMLSRIIADLKSGSNGFNKNEFEKLFKETHEDFYKTLLDKFPNLTKNEIRLCAFAKMNLSTKEISAITQQSTSSIVAARYRLKKKMGLNENENMTNFLIKV